jgi:hypothetical protein
LAPPPGFVPRAAKPDLLGEGAGFKSGRVVDDSESETAVVALVYFRQRN